MRLNIGRSLQMSGYISLLFSRRKLVHRLLPVCLVITALGFLAHVNVARNQLDATVDKQAAKVIPIKAEEKPKVLNKQAALKPAAVSLDGIQLDPSDPTDATWISVPKTRDKFYIYSAYYDSRVTRSVRIIAATLTKNPEQVTCLLYGDNSTITEVVAGKNKLIRENWKLKYSAYFVLCPVKGPHVPKEVSLLRSSKSKKEALSSGRIVVRNNEDKQATDRKGIAVCVKPLHYQYNKLNQLIEFVELNRILGVEHFVFYNHSVGLEVNRALKHYRNLTTILPWSLNITSQKEIRTEGIFAAINDCLYRTMHRYEHVAVIDFDEFIIPRQHQTLKDTLKNIGSVRTASYSFRNAFFYLQWPDDKVSSNATRHLVTLRKTRRTKTLHAHKNRSKYIVRPELVIELGNHFVWERISGTEVLSVHEDVAFMNHYRICEYGGDSCVSKASVVDRRAYHWKKDLVGAVDSVFKMLWNVSSACQLNKQC